jgi:hypothetical protein
MDSDGRQFSTPVIITLAACAILFIALVVLIVVFNIFFKPAEKAPEEREWVSPSEVLADKPRYDAREVVIRGRVSQETVACERKECPSDDPCCGCKPERNLLIVDAEKVLPDETTGRLRMVDLDSKPLCQRVPGECKYECPGWEMDAVYDVSGTFFASPPPSGLRIYLDYFLEVKAKDLVKKGGLSDFPDRATEFFKELLIKLKGSANFYVAP